MNIYNILEKESATLKNSFFNRTLETIDIVEQSVGSNTIRAFRKSSADYTTYKPLSIYRAWLWEYLNNPETILKLKERNDFINVRKQVFESLQTFWTIKDGGKPEFYKFNKLVDLLFKFLPLWGLLDSETRNWVFEKTFVPLDSYSLKLLKKCSDNTILIKQNASMNFVSNEIHYDTIQREIKRLCKHHPVILFDLYAWNKRKGSFELIPLK